MFAGSNSFDNALTSNCAFLTLASVNWSGLFIILEASVNLSNLSKYSGWNSFNPGTLKPTPVNLFTNLKPVSLVPIFINSFLAVSGTKNDFSGLLSLTTINPAFVAFVVVLSLPCRSNKVFITILPPGPSIVGRRVSIAKPPPSPVS